MGVQMVNIMTNEKVRLTFIVPVYNVEKYIQKCVQSIMDQSYCNIEVILVDDGSEDNSGMIIDRTAQIDNRIKVIHQNNAGVSTARNTGLEAASGEYILFIDGDDYIEKDYAEYFLKLIDNRDADMAISINHFTVASNRQILKDNISEWDSLSVMEAIYLDKINVAVWNKIYKKEIIDRYGLSFHTDIWFGEGMLFNIEYLQHTGNIIVGEQKVYHQVYNPNSAMRKFKLENFICGLHSLDIQKAVWLKNTDKLELAWEYHRRNFAKYILCGLVQTDGIKSHQTIYDECKKGMRRNIFLPWKVDIPFKQKIKLTLFSASPYFIALQGKYKLRKSKERQEKFLRIQ